MSTNKGEQQYLDLMQKILDEGVKQTDKGSGVITHSLFGYQMRFDLSEGFPLLTTKKVYWRGVLHELYWFLSGQSNIKYLVDNKVGIWNRTAKLTDTVKDLDRIEIYRPLIADPKEVRKRRAEKAKEEGRADKVTGGRVDPRRAKSE